MPYYISLLKWTDEGIKNIKDSPKRAQAAKAAVERAGGKWIGLYYTLGDYDLVAITEAPDDETLMAVLLAIGSQGSVRTTTLKAFPESEAAQIIEGLP